MPENILLKTFVAKYHISEAYLSSLFAKTAGVSLTNYIMRERVERSEQGLCFRQTEKSAILQWK